ncbi:unnamed protein product [Polarella glacialis]|uniref:Uncharacterized protein n=1 Tax=Polarella glacialis TaxID=89957 RepID=A0A813JYY9_POLGL|nr:unnamed protein product [Polarella glacialis]
MMLHKRLLDEAPLGEESFSLLGSSAACGGRVEQSEAQLASAWAEAGPSSFLSFTARLGCTSCELEAVSNFVNKGGLERSEEAHAFAALAEVRCAAQGQEALEESSRHLEEAVWRGLAYPLLQEAAAQTVMGLRKVGRLLPEASLGRLCRDSSLAVLGSEPSEASERELLRARRGKEDAGSWNPLRVGLAYLDLATQESAERRLETAQALALGALWFRHAAQELISAGDKHVSWLHDDLLQGSSSPGEGVIRTLLSVVHLVAHSAHQVAVSGLTPGPQFLVLWTCSQALAPPQEPSWSTGPWQTWRSSAVFLRLEFLGRQSPFLSPPMPLLSDVRRLADIAERLHTVFARLLQTTSAQDLPQDPGVAGAAHLGLFEAAVVAGRRDEALTLGPFAAQAALQDLGGAFDRSTPDAQMDEIRLAFSRQDSYAEIRGIRLHERSGLAEVLLRRLYVEEGDQGGLAADQPKQPGSAEAEGKQGQHVKALHPALLAEVLALGSAEALGARMEAPVQDSAQLSRHPWGHHHPLRRLVLTGSEKPSIHLKSILQAAMLEIQSLASEGMKIQAQKDEGPIPRGALRLQCAEIGVKVQEGEWGGGSLEVFLKEPRLELVGEDSDANNEGNTEGSKYWQHVAANISAVLSSSVSETESIALLRQICAARAAVRLLATPYSDLAAGTLAPVLLASLSRPAAQTRSRAALLTGGEKPQRPWRSRWLARLAEVHASMLHALGFQNLDPGNCWDDEMFTFSTCCSVGDHEASCWYGSFSEERCCRPLAAPELSRPEVMGAAFGQLVAQACGETKVEIIAPVLAAWLEQPAGRRKGDGLTLSSILADVLEDEARPCGNDEDDVGVEVHDEALGFGGVTSASDQMQWIPDPFAGFGPLCSIELEPRLRQVSAADSIRDASASAPGHQAVTEEVLTRRAQQPTLVHELSQLASAEPRVRTLQRLRATLQRLRTKRNTGRPRPGSLGFSVPPSHAQSVQGSCCGEAAPAWKPLPESTTPAQPSAAERGSRLRLRRRPSHPEAGELQEQLQLVRGQVQEAVAAERFDQASAAKAREREILARLDVFAATEGRFAWEEVDVVDVLSASGKGKDAGHFKELHRVRALQTDGPSVAYHDLSDRSLQVEMLQMPKGSTACPKISCLSDFGPDNENTGQKAPAWPDCIAQGQTLRGTASAGVFANLLSFGITEGCFRDDCTHSDHFASGSPATCARTCASIRACKWWSFWTSRNGGTCWLRRHDEQRATMLESMTGAVSCLPPVAPPVAAGKRQQPQPGESTLFGLAGSEPWGWGPGRPGHQWDLVPVLEAFGHLTPSQLEQEYGSPLQQSAMRFVQKASASARGYAT